MKKTNGTKGRIAPAYKIRRNPNGRTQGYQIYRNRDFQEG